MADGQLGPLYNAGDYCSFSVEANRYLRFGPKPHEWQWGGQTSYLLVSVTNSVHTAQKDRLWQPPGRLATPFPKML